MASRIRRKRSRSARVVLILLIYDSIEILSHEVVTDNPMLYEKKSAVELTGVSLALYSDASAKRITV